MISPGARGGTSKGQITDKDPRIKFQLDAKSAQEIRPKQYDLKLVAGKRYTITLDAVGLRESR